MNHTTADSPTSQPTPRNPLATARLLFWALATPLVLLVGTVVTGLYKNPWTSSCVDMSVTSDGAAYGSQGGGTSSDGDLQQGAPTLGNSGFVHLHHSASAVTTRRDVCPADEPTAMQHVYGNIIHWAPTLFLAAFVVMLGLALLRARRTGIFAYSAARLVTRTGWIVVLGGLALTLVEAVSKALLASTLISDVPAYAFYNFWAMNWTALFAGIGAITLGRVMADGAPLKEELDATV